MVLKRNVSRFVRELQKRELQMSSAFGGAGGMGVAVGVDEQIIVRNGDTW